MSGADIFADRYASRAAHMTQSEVRALFAVAARPDVISLAGGMPFVQALPNEEVLEVVAQVIRDRSSIALQYGAGDGQEGLRVRLTELMAEEGIDSSPDELVVTAGAQQALDLVAKLFIEPGDTILVEAPSYVGALSAFSVYQPKYLQIPMDQDGIIVERLEEALRGDVKPKFLYVCPNFHNPAGVTISLERRQKLVDVCRAAGVPIIEDDPYGMLRFDGDPLPSLHSLDPENVIYLGTLSKIFCPGIRVGWALAQGGVLERLIRFKEAADLCSSNFNMLVAEQWLSEPERWKGSLKGLVEVYRSRRDTTIRGLEEHFPGGSHWTHPQGGFYVWATVPGADLRALLPEAVERKVAYVPGTAFYPDGRGTDQMRIAYCYPPDDNIAEGIKRIGTMLAERL